MDGDVPAKRLHQPHDRPKIVERQCGAKLRYEVKPRTADAGGVELCDFSSRRRCRQQRNATIAALASRQRVEQDRVIGTMRGCLDDNTPFESEMLVECKQRFFGRIGRCEWPPLGERKFAVRADDMKMGVAASRRRRIGKRRRAGRLILRAWVKNLHRLY